MFGVQIEQSKKSICIDLYMDGL